MAFLRSAGPPPYLSKNNGQNHAKISEFNFNIQFMAKIMYHY